MIQYTFKVYPQGRGREVYRVFTMSGEFTLDDLCEYILEEFDFIHEHLYEFCMDNRPYSDSCLEYRDEMERTHTNIPIRQLDLKKGQKFTLHYDYGDDWLFVINTQRVDKVNTEEPPCLLKSKGSVEQYLDYDEWDDEY